MNPLVELQQYGQSFWYDNIRRKLLQDGTIQRLIDEDGLRGMTSNPSIFQKAIGSSDDYDRQIHRLTAARATIEDIYETLVLEDIRGACDMFAELYESSGAADGFVSLEVSPHLAYDYEETVAEARRLFYLVERPNVMIKVPATPSGVRAVRDLIGEGININVTLMFSTKHYEAIAEAYLAGISNLVEQGKDPSRVASVASFFVSRVDTAVDKLLEEGGRSEAKELLGRTAIANAKVVYQRYKAIYSGDRFAELKMAGARPQRLLWASTSTKNPDYPDTLYVDGLVGPNTVNTMPPATIEAFRDHGTVGNALEEKVDEARTVLVQLQEFDVDLEQVTEKLQVDGVQAFADSYDGLMDTLKEKSQRVLSGQML